MRAACRHKCQRTSCINLICSSADSATTWLLVTSISTEPHVKVERQGVLPRVVRSMSCIRWLMALARAPPAGAWSSWSSAALAAALRRLPAVLLMALVMPHCNGISTRHQHEKWVARYSQTIEHGGILAATSNLADSCHARVTRACRECPDLQFFTAHSIEWWFTAPASPRRQSSRGAWFRRSHPPLPSGPRQAPTTPV